MRRGEDVGAEQQAQALEEMTQQQDSAVSTPPTPSTDAPQATDWKQEVSALGVDPGWVVGLRQSLVENGKLDIADIQADKLADPEYRAWLNRQMRKHKEEQQAASSASQPAAAQAPTATETKPGAAPADANSQSAAYSKPAPSVLKPGHMPTGPLWNSTATPAAGGGWVPAGNGKWWPPWPVTGGPVAKPAVMDATAQADALDFSTGQVRRDDSGG